MTGDLPDDGAVIRSERLELPLLSASFLDACLAGDRAAMARLADFAIPEDFPGAMVNVLRLRRGQLERPGWAPWLARAVVLREPARPMVGYVNFHGPPGINDLELPGAAELGYDIFPAHRNRGYATELARALMEWARVEHGIRHFISGIAPDNAPSLRVIEKLGFADTGAVVDGERIFELRAGGAG